jgi:hypothetical protein
MSVFDERPSGMGGRQSGIPRGFELPRTPPPPPSGARTRSGRKLGGVDNGTVALAIGGMSFYWMMPMLMSRRKRRRKPSGDASA